MHDPDRLAVFQGYIVNANRDGSIPTNAKVYGLEDETFPEATHALVAAYNWLAAEHEKTVAMRIAKRVEQ
jgi:hypothetical protein